MQKRKWKKQVIRGERFREQLSKPKIRRFAPEKNNPHGRESYRVQETNKKGELVWRSYTRFCSCKGCQAYLALIRELNPDRAFKLTEFDGQLHKFMRPKALPEHVHRRRMLAQSIGKWK